MGDEQLYVYGFQVVGHTNADTYTNPNCHAYAHSRYWFGGYDQPAAGIDLYFVQRDFYLERGQRDRLLPFRGQLTKWSRYLQFRPSDCALENGK